MSSTNNAEEPDVDQVLKGMKQQQWRARKKAAKQNEAIKAAFEAAEESGLILPPNFAPDVPSANFCYRILETQNWGFSFNLLTNNYEFKGEVVWPDHYGRTLTDALANAIRFDLIGVTGIDFSSAQVWDTLKALCRANPYDPVADYLNGLSWDGTSRVGNWLTRYLSVEPNKYTRAVGTLWLMAAAGRTFYPGIKFDNVLILEGEQGTKKSSAFAALGGEWFSDAELGDVKDKDAIIQLQGVWIQELAELSMMKRSELNALKAFFSRYVDKFRAPHDKVAQIYPRRLVFGGTCNPGKVPSYLTDPTGNRRYWPVKTGLIDLDALRKDRDQLWAEAVHMLREAVKDREPLNFYQALELPEALWPLATAQQESRLLPDGWVDLLNHWLEDPFHDRERDHRDLGGRKASDISKSYGEILAPYLDAEGNKIEKIHSRILLSECLRIPPEKHNPTNGRRLREAMDRVGGWTFDPNLTVGSVKGVSGYRRDQIDEDRG